jgi:hypothetical protein
MRSSIGQYPASQTTAKQQLSTTPGVSSKHDLVDDVDRGTCDLRQPAHQSRSRCAAAAEFGVSLLNFDGPPAEFGGKHILSRRQLRHGRAGLAGTSVIGKATGLSKRPLLTRPATVSRARRRRRRFGKGGRRNACYCTPFQTIRWNSSSIDRGNSFAPRSSHHFRSASRLAANA